MFPFYAITLLTIRLFFVDSIHYDCCFETDRVYGCDTSTRQVYEEGAKRVALSALNGINCEYCY